MSDILDSISYVGGLLFGILIIGGFVLVAFVVVHSVALHIARKRAIALQEETVLTLVHNMATLPLPPKEEDDAS